MRGSFQCCNRQLTNPYTEQITEFYRRRAVTPKNQSIIESVLQRVHARMGELIQVCEPTSKKQEPSPTIEQLRQTVLGLHLTAIAHYAEGYPYPYESDVRRSVNVVGRCLYADPFSQPGSYCLPKLWHNTELGKLVYAALYRFYTEEREGQLLTTAEMRNLFNVERQTIHQWIEDGLIFPVYHEGAPLFYRKDVDRLQKKRAKKRIRGPRASSEQ